MSDDRQRRSPSWSNGRELDGIADVDDLSAGDDTRLVIELKRDANANVVLNNLYKHTPLQTSFGVNMVALVDGVPRTLNLVQALQAYVDHQVEVITRRSEFRLDKARPRAHIVEGLLKALDMIDAIIAAIRALGRPRPRHATALMAEPFEFSEMQANHILDMTPRPADPARPASSSRRRWPSCARRSPSSRRSSPTPAELRDVIKTSWPRSATSSPRPAGREITYDPGDIGRRGPHRRRGRSSSR